jgi:glycosyltransferase involved in cell wall biosynthesis
MKQIILVNHRSQVQENFTGITRYTFSLLETLIDRSHFDLMLITTWTKDRLPQKLQRGLKRIVTVGRPRPYSWNVIWQAFENWGHKLDADIILNVDQIGLVRGGKARVFIAHDLYFRAIPEAIGVADRLQQRYFIWPLMLQFHQKIACVSENTQEDIRRFYPSHGWKAATIGAGADLASVPSERHPILDTLHEPYVLYVGNILPNKNIQTLTQAMDLIARQGLNIRAIHVGRDDQGLLKQAASEIRFAAPPISLGPISDGQLFSLYVNALCFVNTSLYEGFCLPVIEAQQAGTPVVCSSMPAVGQIAGAGAILFDPRSPAQLAEHIQELLRDPQLRQNLRAMGRENASHYSWQKVAERLENICFELLRSDGI